LFVFTKEMDLSFEESDDGEFDLQERLTQRRMKYKDEFSRGSARGAPVTMEIPDDVKYKIFFLIKLARDGMKVIESMSEAEINMKDGELLN